MSLYGGMDYAGDPAGLARSGDAACYARSWTGPAPDARSTTAAAARTSRWSLTTAGRGEGDCLECDPETDWK